MPMNQLGLITCLKLKLTQLCWFRLQMMFFCMSVMYRHQQYSKVPYTLIIWWLQFSISEVCFLVSFDLVYFTILGLFHLRSCGGNGNFLSSARSIFFVPTLSHILFPLPCFIFAMYPISTFFLVSIPLLRISNGKALIRSFSLFICPYFVQWFHLKQNKTFYAKLRHLFASYILALCLTKCCISRCISPLLVLLCELSSIPLLSFPSVPLFLDKLLRHFYYFVYIDSN